MQQLDGVVSSSLGSKSKYFTAGRNKPLPVLSEDMGLADPSTDGAGELHAGSSSRPGLRKRNGSESLGFLNLPSKKKKLGRPYAPPETYAHLLHLPDYLKNNLDGKLECNLRYLTLVNVRSPQLFFVV